MDKLTELENNFNVMRKDVTEIKAALLGNEFNDNGFIQRFAKLEGKIELIQVYVNNEKERVAQREKREKRYARYVGAILGLITILSVCWSYNNKH